MKGIHFLTSIPTLLKLEKKSRNSAKTCLVFPNVLGGQGFKKREGGMNFRETKKPWSIDIYLKPVAFQLVDPVGQDMGQPFSSTPTINLCDFSRLGIGFLLMKLRSINFSFTLIDCLFNINYTSLF